MLPARHVLLPAACCWLLLAGAGCCWLLLAATCCLLLLLLPAAAWQYKSSSAAPLLPLRAPPCIGQGQRIIIILSCPAGRGNTMALKDERSPKYAFPEAGTSLLKSPTKRNPAACCLLLPAAPACCWLLPAPACCWLLLAAAGCCWLLLAA